MPEEPPGSYTGLGLFLINLDRSSKRLAQTWPWLQSLHFPLHRIQGVEGSAPLIMDPRLNSASWIHRIFFGKSMGAGTFGCSLSHIRAWQRLLRSSYAFGLICEDDIQIAPPMVALEFSGLLRRLTQDPHPFWDSCGLQLNHGGMPLTLERWTEAQRKVRLVTYLSPVTGAGCYLITRSGAKKLLSKAYPIHFPVDHYYTRGWEFPLIFCGIEPRPVIQNPVFGSEINQMGRNVAAPLSWREKGLRVIWVVAKSVCCFFYHLALYFRYKMGKVFLKKS